MAQLKAWLLRWLGAASVDELAQLERLRVAHVALVDAVESHKSAIADLIQEVNVLRNAAPAIQAQSTAQSVRVLRNWSEFAAAAQPIKIERKPSA